MNRILLISESYFRDRVYVSDSLNSKLITTTIQEVQDMNLASVIGDPLLNELYSQVEFRNLSPSNKELLDLYIQPLLLYESAAALMIKSNIHVSNHGNVKSSDSVDATPQIDYYKNQAGIALERLTKYLCKNMSSFPLLSGSCLDGIQAHINSTLDTSIYLGSPASSFGFPVDPGYRR